MKIQKSTSFILPILGLSIQELYRNGFKTTYMGSSIYTDNEWGEVLILEFDNSKMTTEFMHKLRNHEFYTDEQDPEVNVVHVIFLVNDYYKTNVVDPFLQGHYSKIDREYVRQCFPPRVQGEHGWTTSINYKILTKDESVANYWREYRGVDIPAGAEVWSRPEKEDEIYGYKEKEQQLKAV